MHCMHVCLQIYVLNEVGRKFFDRAPGTWISSKKAGLYSCQSKDSILLRSLPSPLKVSTGDSDPSPISLSQSFFSLCGRQRLCLYQFAKECEFWQYKLRQKIVTSFPASYSMMTACVLAYNLLYLPITCVWQMLTGDQAHFHLYHLR